jgi:hypothetical protein
MTLALTATTEAMAARKHVRIYKPSPPPVVSQPIYYPLAAAVPVVIAFDIARRTTCDTRIAVSTGPGDPGFDPKGPKTGNFLVPAIYRSECNGVRPKWYGW